MNDINDSAMMKLRVVSHSDEPFQNRSQAGFLLARELNDLKDKKAVVLGIPRGGIVVAQSLAQEINADLDIVISRKLGAPGQSELAIGALAENGQVYLNRNVLDELAVSESYIEREKERQMEEIKRRSRLIRDVLPRVSLAGRRVVLTDDGVATGSTMQAAIWAVRRENPQKLIAAIPVASEEAVSRLAGDVDELVCLRLPSNFFAVGQFFVQFSQVTDEEVLEILKLEQIRRMQNQPSS
jgi:putative phosphoribosyl transferase